MIRYFMLLAILVLLSAFFAFFPVEKTSSQVGNVNGIDCSKLMNANFDHPKYAPCAAWANSMANLPMNAANISANMAANAVGDFSDLFTAELPTCTDQPEGTDQAFLYFLNAQDLLDTAGHFLQGDDYDSYPWKKLRREAVRCLTKALALDPSNRTYLLKRAEVNDDDRLLAIRDITKVIEAYPDDTNLYILRAEAYTSARQMKLALGDYTKAISLEPKNTDFYLKRSLFFELTMKDKERALADLDSALDIDPFDVRALDSRADIYESRKDYANALRDRTRIIEKSPTVSFNYLSRAAVYEVSGQLSKALADVNTAIKLSPKSYSYYEARAKLYRKTGQNALALRDEQTAKRLEAQLMKELEEN